MKVCVFGAGAIGSHIAARMAAGGAEVSVVARGPHLEAIRSHGLTVQLPQGELKAKVAASDTPADLGLQDAVIVTVKAPSLTELAVGVGPLLGPETPVVFVMNGIPWWYFHRHGGELDGRRLPRLDPGGRLWDSVGPARAIGGVVYSAVTVVAPGVVRSGMNQLRLVIGEADGQPSDRTEAIAGLLRQGGAACDISPRIRHEIWTKLVMNLSSNPMVFLTGTTVQEAFAEPACADAARHLVAETMAIARALGCELGLDIDKVVASGRSLAHKPSIVQDLSRGKPLELDALFVAPLELARMVGVPTPMLELLVTLCRLRARAAGLYDGAVS